MHDAIGSSMMSYLQQGRGEKVVEHSTSSDPFIRIQVNRSQKLNSYDAGHGQAGEDYT